MQSETEPTTPEPTSAPKRNLLERSSHISQIISSIAVVISLIYVGLQLQQNTAQLRRAENNAGFNQFQAVRLSIANNREVAELLNNGLSGQHALDTTDQIRFDMLLAEFTGAFFQIWDRVRGGLLDKEMFEKGVARYLALALCSGHGSTWWARTKASFDATFVRDIDRIVAETPQERCVGYAPAPS